jgi:hypothetical protein
VDREGSTADELDAVAGLDEAAWVAARAGYLIY